MVKPGARLDLATGSDPHAAERFDHHPDDHETEAIYHDDDIIDHDHDRPANERSALVTTGDRGGSNLSDQLTSDVGSDRTGPVPLVASGLALLSVLGTRPFGLPRWLPNAARARPCPPISSPPGRGRP
jgi:hypothetical protein